MSRSKNILAIIPYSYQPYHSGGQKLITHFFDFLGQETNLTVITVKGMDISNIHSYKAIPLLKASRSRYYDVSLIKKIIRIVKEKQIEEIIWEHPYYAWLAYFIKRKTGVKTIFQTQNIEFQRFRSMKKWWWPILRQYEKWSFKLADLIYFITPEDKAFAINNWQINPAKTEIVPYGIEINKYPEDKIKCREEVAKIHTINEDENIFLFNGVLSYYPNIEALNYILNNINPLLFQQGLKYKILVCGKGLAPEMNELKDFIDKNIIYVGFVNDIDLYSKAADLLLNPVQSGGGIKTKMVEAIAFGTTVISTKSGAAGINPELCKGKLIIVEDNDWIGFAGEVKANTGKNVQTPEAYYNYFYYGNIIKRLIS